MAENFETEGHPPDLIENQHKKLWQLKVISEQIDLDLPLLVKIRGDLLIKEQARHLPDHPIEQLCQYFESLISSCLQIAYSIDRLSFFVLKKKQPPLLGISVSM